MVSGPSRGTRSPGNRRREKIGSAGRQHPLTRRDCLSCRPRRTIGPGRWLAYILATWRQCLTDQLIEPAWTRIYLGVHPIAVQSSNCVEIDRW
jgi:hypothetical protein